MKTKTIVSAALAAMAFGFAQAETMRWAGPVGGTWNNDSNWRNGDGNKALPKSGDTLVFDTANDRIESVNDLTGFSAARLELKGSRSIVLSGNGITLTGDVVSEQSSDTVAAEVGLPIELVGTSGAVTIDVSTAGGKVNFNGVLSGAAEITVQGAIPTPGRVGLTAANTFTSDLRVNLAELDVYNDAALGTTDGYTYLTAQEETGYSPAGKLHFHGVDLMEPIRVYNRYGNNGYQLYFYGICHLKGDLANTGDAITFRCYYDKDSEVHFYEISGQSANTQIVDGGGPADVSFHGKITAGGLFRFSTTSRYHLYKINTTLQAQAASTLVLEAEDVFVNDAGTVVYPVKFDYSSGTGRAVTMDLNGHDQRLTKIQAGANAGACVKNSSATPATLTYTAAGGTTFAGKYDGNLSVVVGGTTAASPYTLTGASTASGVLTVPSGNKVVMSGSGAWWGPVGALDLQGELEFSNASATPVTQAVSNLTIGATTAARGTTYGPAGTAEAGVIPDSHITGNGYIAVSCPFVQTWTGAAQDNDIANPANYAPGGALVAGDTLSFGGDGALTLTCGADTPALGGIAFTGRNAVTLGGAGALKLAAGSQVRAEGGADASVSFNGPVVLDGGIVTFVSVSNQQGGVTFNFNGGMSGAGGLATGGDDSGTYNFYAANTYTGHTYFTNAMAYHLYDGAALGGTTEGTTYVVPRFVRQYDTEKAVNQPASPLYFHGVDISEPFRVNCSQHKGFVFPANTTSVLRGTVNATIKSVDVERWTVETGAKVTFKGDASFNDVSQFYVSGVMRFEGKFTTTSILRASAGGVGRIEFANEVNGGTVGVWDNGTVVMDEGAVLNAALGCNAAGTLELASSQTPKSLSLGTVLTVTSANGSTLNLKDFASASTPGLIFAGDAGLCVDNCMVTLDRTQTSTGAVLVRNGGSLTLKQVVGWRDASAADTSVLAVDASGVLDAAATVALASGAKLKLKDGTAQTVSGLTIGGTAAQKNKRYGASSVTAEVVDETHFEGTGTILVQDVVVGTRRTWQGGDHGNWSDSANWSPAGAPGVNDTLVFDATASAVAVTNDLQTAVTFASLEFLGGNAVTLAGNTVELQNRSVVKGVGATTVRFACPLKLADEGEIEFNATGTAEAHVRWYFDGGLTGAGAFKTAGDETAEYHFTADSPDYDGDIYLVNGSAYHVYCNRSLGSTVGFTRYEVTSGTAAENEGRTVAKFAFHGVTVDEDFYWSGFTSHSLVSCAGTTNVFNGRFDAPVDAQAATERWDFEADSSTTFNGPIGMGGRGKSTKGYVDFLFIAAARAFVDLHAAVRASSYVRALPVGAGSVVQLSSPVPENTWFGAFAVGTLRFGAADLFSKAGAGYAYGAAATVDFNGFSQTIGKVGAYGGNMGNARGTVFTSAAAATCTLALGADATVMNTFAGALSVAVPAGSDVTFQSVNANSSTGTLSVASGAHATVSAASAWQHLDNSGQIGLGAGIQLVVETLTLGGVAQTPYRSYGSSASSAIVQDDTYFDVAGTGVVNVTPTSAEGVTRVWKGTAASLSDSTGWEPAGVPQTGDTLWMTTASTGQIAIANDLPAETYLAGLVFSNGTFTVTGGSPITLLDRGLGIVSTNAHVTFACGLDLRASGDAGKAVDIVAAADATNSFTGVIAGNAKIVVKGQGENAFSGENTFTGDLSVEGGAFRASGASPFGTADGKTTFTVGTDAFSHVYFDGLTTDDDIVWIAIDDDFRGFFKAASESVFNGTFTATVKQPRWWLLADAAASFNGDVTYTGAFTVFSAAGSTLNFNRKLTGGSMRFQGYGTINLAGAVRQGGTDYALLYGSGTPTANVLGDNLFGSGTAASPCRLDVGVFSLGGHTLDVSFLLGTAATTVTGDEGAVMHVTKQGSTFAGRVAGAMDLSIDMTAADDLVPTQTLSGVSTSTGALMVKNGSVVNLTGAWAGDIVVEDGSKVIVGARTSVSKDSVIRINGTGKLVIENGAVLRCKELYINGVKCDMPDVYNAAKDAVHFGGTGSLRFGRFGTLLMVR